ncbi:MAG: hypothetical protein WCS17_13115 [Prevotella sp.]
MVSHRTLLWVEDVGKKYPMMKHPMKFPDDSYQYFDKVIKVVIEDVANFSDIGIEFIRWDFEKTYREEKYLINLQSELKNTILPMRITASIALIMYLKYFIRVFLMICKSRAGRFSTNILFFKNWF